MESDEFRTVRVYTKSIIVRIKMVTLLKKSLNKNKSVLKKRTLLKTMSW